MKRAIFTLIMGLMLSVTAFSQKTVAVYVTSSEGVSNETKSILGSELVAAITKTNEYVAVERTADFMAQVSKEQGNYEIDDAKLYDLGRKFGASNVCVADVTKFGDEYYIVARLLDIKTSKVWRTSKKYAKLASLRELVETSEALANDLFGKTKELSTYAYGDNMDNNSYIVRIENRGNYTKVTIKYLAVKAQQQIGVDRGTYIEDLSSNIQYKMTDAANITIVDQNNRTGKTIGSGILEYSLFFERIDDDAQNIKIIEPNGRKYNDIVLRPYGDVNTFVFEDNTREIYDKMCIAEQNKIQGAQLFKKSGSYYLGDKKLTKREYQDLLESCPEAWAKYKKGKAWTTVGWISAIAGFGTAAVLGFNELFGDGSFIDSDSVNGVGLIFAAGGAIGLLSIPEFIIGKNRKYEAYKEYNKNCPKPATLSMGVTSNGGVGFTLNF